MLDASREALEKINRKMGLGNVSKRSEKLVKNFCRKLVKQMKKEKMVKMKKRETKNCFFERKNAR